jgi:hypothetical protein
MLEKILVTSGHINQFTENKSMDRISYNIEMNEDLISKGVFLNHLLVEHANIFNIDLLNSDKSMQEVIVSKSNDYSILEDMFKKVTGSDLLNGNIDIDQLPLIL